MKTPYEILYERIIEMRNQRDRMMFTASEIDIMKVNIQINFFEKAAEQIYGLSKPKMKEFEVHNVMKLYKKGWTIKNIAEGFSVDKASVEKLVKNNIPVAC